MQALTSGTIPGFIDIVMNFDSVALAEDNLISQMRRQGRQLFFYGDDTWMKLFPDHFTDADGTTSFFVTDYTEVRGPLDCSYHTSHFKSQCWMISCATHKLSKLFIGFTG